MEPWVLCRGVRRASTAVQALASTRGAVYVSSTMIDERLIVAIGRLERALTRVETAAARAAPDAALARRHQSLRSEVGAAIARIDRLTEPAATTTGSGA